MLRRRMLRKGLALILVLILALGTALPIMAEDNTAKAVRLEKTEGEVSVLSAAGKTQDARSGLRLYSGCHVITQAKSYAWLSLDTDRVAKADENTDLEIRRTRRKLEVLAASGNVYFNVNRPLEKDETLNIRTSTIAMGVRGTTGWVEVVDGWVSRVYLLEGSVTATVTDPVSGQSKTLTVGPGQCGEFRVFDPSTPGEKVSAVLLGFSRQDVPGFVLRELVGKTELLQKIYEESGIDLRDLTEGTAAARQLRDEDEHAGPGGEKTSISGRVEKDPVWSEGDGESESQEREVVVVYEKPATETTLTTDATVPQVIAALRDYSLVELRRSGSGTFNVNQALTVPAGRQLDVQGDVVVDEGVTLRVDGTMDIAGNLTNHGTTIVTSGDTLIVGGQTYSDGSLEITATGHFRMSGKGIRSLGSMTVAGRIDGAGSVVIEKGSFSMTDGEIRSSNGKAALKVEEGKNVSFAGGSIINTSQAGAAVQWSDKAVSLTAPKTALLSQSVNPVQDGSGNALSIPGLGVVEIGNATHGIGVVKSAPASGEPEEPEEPETAKYRVNTLLLTQGGSLEADKTEAEAGDTVAVTAKAEEGWKRNSLRVLKLDGGSVSLSGDDSFPMPEGDVLIVAEYEEIQKPEEPVYRISLLTLTEGGSLKADKTEAKEEDTVIVTPEPEEGWKLANLRVLPLKGGALTPGADGSFTMPGDDVLITAEFVPAEAEATQYRVTAAVLGEGGTVTTDKSLAEAGETVAVTAQPETNRHLKALVLYTAEDGMTEIQKNTFTMPDGDALVLAAFDGDEGFSITALDFGPDGSLGSVGHGVVVPDVTRAYKGDTVTLTAEPKAGWVLDSLIVRGLMGEYSVDAENLTFTMPDDDVVVLSSFRPEDGWDYPVHLRTVGEKGRLQTLDESGEPIDAAKEGDKVLVAVQADSGYTAGTPFLVSGSGVTVLDDVTEEYAGLVSGDTRLYAFTMPGEEVSVCAVFDEASCSISGYITGVGEPLRRWPEMPTFTLFDAIDPQEQAMQGFSAGDWSIRFPDRAKPGDVVEVQVLYQGRTMGEILDELAASDEMEWDYDYVVAVYNSNNRDERMDDGMKTSNGAVFEMPAYSVTIEVAILRRVTLTVNSNDYPFAAVLFSASGEDYPGVIRQGGDEISASWTLTLYAAEGELLTAWVEVPAEAYEKGYRYSLSVYDGARTGLVMDSTMWGSDEASSDGYYFACLIFDVGKATDVTVTMGLFE